MYKVRISGIILLQIKTVIPTSPLIETREHRSQGKKKNYVQRQIINFRKQEEKNTKEVNIWEENTYSSVTQFFFYFFIFRILIIVNSLLHHQ